MAREARSIRCPESVLGWIPWYGEHAEDGRSILTDRQRGIVEAHAAECSDCRAEIDMIAGAPYEIDVELPDPDRMFDEITARIDAGEAESADAVLLTPVIPIDRARTLSGVDYGKLARWVFAGDAQLESHPETTESAMPSPEAATGNVIEGPWARSSVFAAAAAIALFFLGGLGGAFLTNATSSDNRADTPMSAAATTAATGAVYELAAAGAASSAPMIDVVFVDTASVSEISRALHNVGVEIVSGPSNLGVYRLQMRVAKNESAASVSDAAAIAARLKANPDPIVIFAEPVL